ncbi:MAG: LPS assembly protein LptD [Candidatus Competibacteraceae bacterium]|nr:LPS assembly protein LptD [Candidatus Competibacteraceae bacterium]
MPLQDIQAQQPERSGAWIQCEADDLAREIVPSDPNALTPDQAPIQAEAGQVESSPTYSVLESNVRLSRGVQRLRADRMTLERPANRARVEGPFVYGDSRQALRGKSAEVDLNAETGWFKDVDYYLPERNAQGSAEEIELNRRKQRSRFGDATYSTCARGREEWELRAHKMTLNHDTGRGAARDVVLALWDTPVFYFPYLSFPITDERQSGFLFPIEGHSSTTGFDLTVPYYWNIAPDRDMTIAPRLMTERGVLLGIEYRFLSPWHRGEINFEYMPDDRHFGGDRGSFNVLDRAAPLPNTYTDLRYEYVSDDDYLKDLSNNLGFLTPNYLERHLDARYFGDWWQVLARVQGYQILNSSLFSLTGNPYQRLPQLLFSGAWPPIAGGLRYGLRGELVNFQQSDVVTGTRFDLWPTVSWGFERPWGYLKPEAGFRYTGYQLDNIAPSANDAPSRAAPIASLDSSLIFERSLKANWLGIADGVQTLEPRLFYLYVPYRNQDAIPLFDTVLMDRDHDWLFRHNRFVGADRLGDANQVTLALTSRAIDGASGRERLRASIGQIQYFEDRRVTLMPNAPPETTANSGLIAQGQFNFSSRWSLQGSVQLEPDNNDLLRAGLDVRYYADPRRLVNVSYLMDRDQPGMDLGDQIQAADISLMWPLNSQWRIMGRWNQALNLDRNLETLAGVEYEDCCWAVRAVARQYRNSPAEIDSQTAFYVELELKGLSRLGSGLENQLKTSILGYQPLR